MRSYKAILELRDRFENEELEVPVGESALRLTFDPYNETVSINEGESEVLLDIHELRSLYKILSKFLKD